LALVIQEVLEHPPPGIQDGFRHLGFHEIGAADIADDYLLILIDHLSRKLMQRVLALIRGLAVNPLRLFLVPAPLRVGERYRVALRPAPGLKGLAVARGRDSLEPEVDADRFHRRHRLIRRHGDWQTQPPVPDRILSKAAVAPLYICQRLALEYPEDLAAESQRITAPSQTGRFERYPSK
jgi:hypothetical protein